MNSPCGSEDKSGVISGITNANKNRICQTDDSDDQTIKCKKQCLKEALKLSPTEKLHVHEVHRGLIVWLLASSTCWKFIIQS